MILLYNLSSFVHVIEREEHFMSPEIIETILWICKIGIFIVETISFGIWKMSLSGTYRRYVAKSTTKFFIILIFISSFIHGVFAWSLTDSSSEKAWAWILAALYFAFGSLDYWRLSQDDEDDFFTKSFKDAKRWLKNFSASMRRRRHAYVRP